MTGRERLLVILLGASLTGLGCTGEVVPCRGGRCGPEPVLARIAADMETGVARAPSPVSPGPPSTPDPEPEPEPPPLPPPPPQSTAFGCPLFPRDNPWNQDISGAPVDPRSADYLARMNAASAGLHFYFGSDTRWGIPVVPVPGHQARVPIRFTTYARESDPGPYPIPLDAPVEGGPSGAGDRHILAVDISTCMLYELFDAHREGAGYRATSGAIFDLTSNDRRPEGWTSADAAGLPMLPGLVRPEEVAAGEILHALRFTIVNTQRAYVHPASHFASDITDSRYPPMGLRVRLKASYDLSRFRGAALVILRALKKYGMFLADNGRDWAITGQSATWNDSELLPLETVPASAFEVVQHGTVYR